jgi:hypothetical protein
MLAWRTHGVEDRILSGQREGDGGDVPEDKKDAIKDAQAGFALYDADRATILDMDAHAKPIGTVRRDT